MPKDHRHNRMGGGFHGGNFEGGGAKAISTMPKYTDHFKKNGFPLQTGRRFRLQRTLELYGKLGLSGP